MDGIVFVISTFKDVRTEQHEPIRLRANSTQHRSEERRRISIDICHDLRKALVEVSFQVANRVISSTQLSTARWCVVVRCVPRLCVGHRVLRYSRLNIYRASEAASPMAAQEPNPMPNIFGLCQNP